MDDIDRPWLSFDKQEAQQVPDSEGAQAPKPSSLGDTGGIPLIQDDSIQSVGGNIKPSAAPPVSGRNISKGNHNFPTMFHAATASTPQEKKLTWGETFSEAGKNLLPSAGEVVGSFAHAISHPSETLSSLGQIGGGLVSKAEGALGTQQDPEEKKKSERYVDALLDHYKKTYFTSTDDFKRAFAKDPASILMDFSTLLGAGSAAMPAKAAL